MAAPHDYGGKVLRELLPSDKYRNSQKFVGSEVLSVGFCRGSRVEGEVEGKKNVFS